VRVLLLGATGAIGAALTPRLAGAGHTVFGTSRTAERAGRIAALGAEPLAADLLDPGSLTAALEASTPDAVINQVTAIPPRIDTRHIEREFAATNRLRAQGTANLVAALRGSDARLVAQSIAFAYAPGPRDALHVESDPLDLEGERSSKTINAALDTLERTVRGAGGTVLRYGYLYGPGTAFARGGSSGAAVARRRFPLVGDGDGVWSFVHVADAAGAAVAALSGPPDVYNIVDRRPARVAEWLPAFARALGAPPPRRVPVWLARVAAGRYGVNAMTLAQGASGALAREHLALAPQFDDWREGFRDGLG
jgi:nucleoside-diphosphate-sugar epimerase